MEKTPSFLALETMLQQGWLMASFPEFQELLKLLEDKGLLSASEHQSLLKLAETLKLDQLSPSGENDHP